MSGNINIVFACDSNYAQHATVAMMSILKNTVDPTRIVFYLLDDQIDLSVKRKMQTSIEQAHAAIHFCEVAADQFASFFVSGQLSRAAYFRLEMGHLLPSTVERVIYLDCDLLVLDDIAALWNHDMGGHPLAAVMDLGIMASSKDWRGKQERLGFSKRDRYFNSGVLMVDLAAWRAHDYGRQAEQLAAKNAYRHHDQDAPGNQREHKIDGFSSVHGESAPFPVSVGYRIPRQTSVRNGINSSGGCSRFRASGSRCR